MRVLKFGGSSVATPERINGIIEILKTYTDRKFAVVFSAFGGVTDSLIKMGELAAAGDEGFNDLFEAFSRRHQEASEALLHGPHLHQVLQQLHNNHEVLKNLLYGIFLVREASPRTMDYVLSFGERNSAFIIAHAMQQAGIPSAYLDARLIIKTDKNFGSAKVDFEATNEKVRTYFANTVDIQVVTGFIASAKGGLTTTLGRGGSDYTASILAAALEGVEAIEIWTDVDGVLTADPRKVKRSFTISKMTYAEAMEMSHFGAKVIYPPTLLPALAKKIPLYIKNTFNPSFLGTYISNEAESIADIQQTPIKGISSISQVSLLTLQGGGLFGAPGIAGRLFTALAQANINVIMITQGSSEHSITFAIQPEFGQKAKKAVESAFEFEINMGTVDTVKIENELSIIAIIGENMRYRPGIAGRLFRALGKNGINVVAIAQGSSELNISVVVNKGFEAKALNTLHDAFFLSETLQLNLFMVGPGLIGGTLLRQLEEQADYLKKRQEIEIRLIGIANSKKMYFGQEGIPFKQALHLLQEKGEPLIMGTFIERMKSLNLANSIFVDNTSSEEVAGYYSTILNASISISTPNKIAASGPLKTYKELKMLANKRGVPFMYETNVGAGLPVISTLNDLINSGDQILKIEAVLSGSLSYIFNTFKGEAKFSEIIYQAKGLGYTEPDPRTDLSGKDVSRKILILARETGLPMEIQDVVIENVLPQSCQEAKDIPCFFEELEKHNDHFEALKQQAAQKGAVLHMVAHLENGVAKVGLQEVQQNHPFYTLSGADNMIVFTTTRYKERPLVVRGPGAGAEVTAAGIFAEIIKIGNYLA